MPSESQEETSIRLNGPKVHVYKYGRLYARPFLRARRALTVNLRGTKLTVNYHHLGHSADYELREAHLFTIKNSLKIVLQLPSAEKLCFFAHDEEEFDSWKHALTETINWGIERFYEFRETLGQGAFATVVRGLHFQTQDVVAIKILTKKLCSDQELDFLQREVDILQTLKHPNVIHMSDLFESQENLYVVLEYLDGGTLRSFVASNRPLSEANVRDLMKDILSGMMYVHSKGTVHRDIKPENLMCTSKDFPTIIKILDFGLSRLVGEKAEPDPNADELGLGPDGLMTSPVGTPNFAAPEMLSGLPYGQEVDCFACGVVMYWLFCDYYPFADSDPDRLLELIKETDFEFPAKDWSTVSDEAKQVIRGLLDRSPYERLTAEQALQRPWFHKELPTMPIMDTNINDEERLTSTSNGMRFAPGNPQLGNVVNVRSIDQSMANMKRHTSLQVRRTPKEPDDLDLLQPSPNRCVSWYK